MKACELPCSKCRNYMYRIQIRWYPNSKWINLFGDKEKYIRLRDALIRYKKLKNASKGTGKVNQLRIVRY